MLDADSKALLERVLAETQAGRLQWTRDADDYYRAELGINATPIFHRLFRWRNATPQYDVGHLQRVDAIEAYLPSGIWVTGSPYRGIGIPDCVHQAQQTADQLWQKVA